VKRASQVLRDILFLLMFIQKNIPMKQGDALLRAISLHIVVRGELARFGPFRVEQLDKLYFAARSVLFFVKKSFFRGYLL